MGAPSKKRATFWQRHVEAVATSGMKPGEYCKRHGLKACTFYRWQARFRSGKKVAARKMKQLVPVGIAEAPRGVETSLRMTLPALGVVEIRGDFSAVAKVVQLVRWEVA